MSSVPERNWSLPDEPDASEVSRAIDATPSHSAEALLAGRELSELSPSELKPAIVEMLAQRPHTSCKKSDVSSLLRKFLGVKGRLADRRRYEVAVRRAVGHLIIAKIVEDYRAKNRRIRLADDYEARFYRLVRNSQDSDARAETRSTGQADLFSLTGPPAEGEEPAVERPRTGSDRFELPELPDEPEEEDAPEQSEGDNDAEDEVYPEPRGEDDSKPGRTSDPRPSAPRPNVSHIESLILDLARGLKDTHGIEVRRQLHTLHLLPSVGFARIHGTVEFRPSSRRLFIRIAFPFTASAMLSVLKLFSQESMSSILCVEADLDPPQFVIRRAIDLRSEGTVPIREAVIEVLGDALRAIELIERLP